jgi:hypothetical protein
VNAGFASVGRALKGGWKLVTLRRASRDDFPRSAELFALLVLLDLALMFAFAIVTFGMRGELNLFEALRALTFVPVVLATGLLAYRVDRESSLLLLPIALASASVIMTTISWTLYLLAQYRWLPWVEAYWFGFDYFALAWSAAIIIGAVVRLIRASLAARTWLAATALALLLVPTIWLPQGALWMPRADAAARVGGASFHTLAEEDAFYAQQRALDRELGALEPERPGIADLYLVAAGLYAGEDVFMKDVERVADLFGERFDTSGRTVRLVNNAKTLDRYPIASLTSIRESLRRLGEIMNRNEDVLMLYLTSHGSETHELVVDFRPLRFRSVDPVQLKAALDDAGMRWKVVVISACYSGGFIDALKDERTLIITAARADRASFGCGSASDATYLARALFDEALRNTHSLEAAFAAAAKSIAAWEREKGYEPSDPQMFVGAEIRPKLAEIERRLAAGARRPQ